MRGDWLGAAGVGAVLLVGSIVAARGPVIPPWERRVFHAVNGLPGWLFPLLWPAMQLGNLVVGTVAGLAVAGAGEVEVAVGVLLAMVLKLVTERVLRRELRGHIPARRRPGTSQEGAILRGGDVPADGSASRPGTSCSSPPSPVSSPRCCRAAGS